MSSRNAVSICGIFRNIWISQPIADYREMFPVVIKASIKSTNKNTLRPLIAARVKQN